MGSPTILYSFSQIPSELSTINALFGSGNLDLGHLIDTLNYLATPCSCSRCPPGQSFGLDSKTVLVGGGGPLGQGIGDLDSGLTIIQISIYLTSKQSLKANYIPK